jgi:hypothetical protein
MRSKVAPMSKMNRRRRAEKRRRPARRVVPESIATMVAKFQRVTEDSDTRWDDVSLADARAWVDAAIELAAITFPRWRPRPGPRVAHWSNGSPGPCPKGEPDTNGHNGIRRPRPAHGSVRTTADWLIADRGADRSDTPNHLIERKPPRWLRAWIDSASSRPLSPAVVPPCGTRWNRSFRTPRSLGEGVGHRVVETQ